MIFRTLIIVFFACLSQFTFAQKLTHNLGEILVEVRTDRDAYQLASEIMSSKRYSSDFSSRKVISNPSNIWLFTIDPNQANELEFLKDLRKNKYCLQAQLNHKTSLRQEPNDPLFINQWQYINTGQEGIIGADIDMDLAWDYTTGGVTVDGDTIVACVIDDGINLDHEDFGNNLWVNHAEIPNNDIDDDNNGYVDDYLGWNAYQSNDAVGTGASHGTSVSGIIGAKGNNGVGVAGINWDIKVMFVLGGGTEAEALAAYAYPYTMRKKYNETNGQEGAYVVCTNASWGTDFGQPDDAPIWCDFYNQLGEEGILNFGATANANVNVDQDGDLPTGCSSPYLVSVTNLNSSDEKVSGAGYGSKSIDLGAYGRNTYTIRSSGYGGFGGTSGATPHVAGTAALLYSADCPEFMQLAKSNPDQAALVVKDCILHGVVELGDLVGITTSGGKLNANNAIQNILKNCDDCTEAFGAMANNITDHESVISWPNLSNIGQVNIRYRKEDDAMWTTVENISSPYTINNLDPCQYYEYQIQTICNNETSPFTYSRYLITDGCCDIPLDVNIEVTNNLAILEWSDVLAATSYYVEWKNTQDDEWIVLEINDENTTLSGIQSCELYELRIKSNCTGSGLESEYTTTYNFSGPCGACSMDYCSFGEKNVSDEWIDTVSIKGVFTNGSGPSETGYVNYFDEFYVELLSDEEYELALVPGYSGTIYDEYFAAFIDFNQNGEFDSEEEILSNGPTQSKVSSLFSVPNDALYGVTRMRIVMRYNAEPGACDNGSFEYGEIEDYCVYIADTLGCPNDYIAINTDSSQTSLEFLFPEDDRVTNYILEYKERGASAFNIIQSDENFVVVDGLKKCQEYEVRSTVECNGYNLPYSNIEILKTACNNSTSSPNLSVAKAYPNPAQDFITISSPIKEVHQYALYALNGRIVNKGIADKNEFRIDLSTLNPGVYLLNLNMDDEIQTIKVVKIGG